MVDKIITPLPEKSFTQTMKDNKLSELKDSIETVDDIKTKLNSKYVDPDLSRRLTMKHHKLFIQ